MIRRQYLLAVTLATAIVTTDLITKRLAALNLRDADVIVIPGFLELTYTENPGAAFSLFQGAGPLLGIAAVIVSALILWALRLQRPTLEVVAFGFVLGGAIGNFVDRLMRGEGFLDGKVIDWVNLWWIPTFNVADSAVTTAVVLLLIQAWRSRES